MVQQAHLPGDSQLLQRYAGEETWAFSSKSPFWGSKLGSGEVFWVPQYDPKARHGFTGNDLQKSRLFQS